MANFLVAYVEKSIKQGRHRRVTTALLAGGNVLLNRAVFSSSLRKLVLQGMILIANVDGDRRRASQLLVEYSAKDGISWRMLIRYVNAGDYDDADRILQSANLPREMVTVLKAAVLRLHGKIDDAIAVLQGWQSDSYAARAFVTDFLRNLYHQKQDHEAMAELLLRFVEAEPGQILINQAIAAAGSSEVVGREDIFAAAISRVLDDCDRVLNDPLLFKKFWKTAITAAVTTYNFDLAVSIAARASKEGLNSTTGLNEIAAVRADLLPIMSAVKAARRDILARCGRLPAVEPVGDVVVVFPAAAVRTHKLDYPGFRAEIRQCLKAIIETIESIGLSYVVKTRIRTHGPISFDRPYFSYHTISDDCRGLHYKETDRRSLFSFDNKGYAGWSEFAATASNTNFEEIDQTEADNFFRKDRETMVASRSTKYTQDNIVDTLPPRFIFVGLQVIGDAVQSLAYATPFVMMDEVRATAARFGLAVVVKRHPACRSPEITRYLADHGSELTIATGNIHDIIPASLAVCVINSGVGAEALMYEKPVYVFGRADYMGASFVCAKPGDFSLHFSEGKSRLDAKALRRFWLHYRTRYACDLREPKASKDWISARVRQHLQQATSPQASQT